MFFVYVQPLMAGLILYSYTFFFIIAPKRAMIFFIMYCFNVLSLSFFSFYESR